MTSEIWTATVAGIFLILNTIVSVIIVNVTKRINKSVNDNSVSIKKKFEETAKFIFVQGERATFDELTRITLEEPQRIRVTRFNPRKIERKERYFKAVSTRILGEEFEGEKYGKLEKYNRLTSINSLENKESLIHQIDYYLEKGCNNLVLRVTNDKNDYEIVISEGKRIAAFCFHDMGKQEVLQSAFITSDHELYIKFTEMYEKIWAEDTLMEIDFSLGRSHILAMRDKLQQIEPVMKRPDLSPLDNIINEAMLKIEGCKIMQQKLYTQQRTELKAKENRK